MAKEKKPTSEMPQTPKTPKKETASSEPKEYKPGDTYEVPAEGSLGLLALGYRGLEAWRKAQQKATVEKSAETITSENTKTANEAEE